MNEKTKRQLTGNVVSDKMDKTIVVAVHRKKMDSKYRKARPLTRTFKVHDPKNEYHVGDTVVFEEMRPLSKQKRWKVVKAASSPKK